MQRVRLAVLMASVLTIPAVRAGVSGKPDIQTLRVDRTEFDEQTSAFCNLPIEVHEVGTVRVFSFPDGKAVVEVNGQQTYRNLFGGKAVTLDSAFKITDLRVEQLLAGGGRSVAVKSIFTGLDYRIRQTGRPIVSAGRGVVTATYTLDADGFLIDFKVEKDVRTPGLEHLFAVICRAVSDVPVGHASISGRITDAATGAPLKDVCVVAYDAASGRFVDFSRMNAPDGTYRVPFLPAGRYKVFFADCGSGGYFPQWYDGKAVEVYPPYSAFWTADVVTVGERSNARGIDAALTLGGRISGRVTDQATSQPIPGFPVELFDLSFPPGTSRPADAVTDVDGTYRFAGLLPRDYKLVFSESFPHRYAPEWYDDKPTFEAADIVRVSLGAESRGIDAALALGGTISGSVTDEAGMPLADVCVSAAPLALAPIGGSFSVFEITDPDGHYRLPPGLQAGDHKVFFSGRCAGNYASEWYNDSARFSSADPVTVALGVDTAGIDAALATGGSVSGIVTDAVTGAPLGDIAVEILASDFEGYNDFRFGFPYTGPDGTYSAIGLAAGHYTVEFFDESRRYLREIYDDKPVRIGPDGLPDLTSADLVTVLPGVDTPGIDAALTAGGSISGTVTDAATGTPVPGIELLVYPTDQTASVSFGFTGADGTYVATQLPTGEYAVDFADHFFRGYGYEFYNDKPDLASADPVRVTAGVDTPAIDAALAPGQPVAFCVPTCADTCAGGTTGCSQPCDAGTSGCVCVSTIEGSRACVQPVCSLADYPCVRSAECGSDAVCFTEGCCGS